MTQTITINPLTRLEGTGKVKIELEGGVLKDLQFGVQTGDPRSWTSYDEVWKAFCTHRQELK